MDAIIRARQLSKRFGDHTVFSDLDLSVVRGQIYALIGPSGSGKTTLIRILCGLLRPDEGRVSVLGWEVPNFRIQPQIGYMPQETALYSDLTVMQNLAFFGELYDLPRKQARERAEELLELLRLERTREQNVATLSGGMKRRVSLIASLLHKPRLLFLDEPTVGLDPELRNALWDHFHELSQQDVTLLVTTHHMDEATRCDSVGVLNQGRMLAEGAADTLLERTGADSLEAAVIALAKGDV